MWLYVAIFDVIAADVCNVFFLFVYIVEFDLPTSDVSEDDGIVTLEIKKTEKIDFDIDVIIIPVPLTAGELRGVHKFLSLYVQITCIIQIYIQDKCM